MQPAQQAHMHDSFRWSFWLLKPVSLGFPTAVCSCSQARLHETSHYMTVHRLWSQLPLNSNSNNSIYAFIHSAAIVLPLDCSIQNGSAPSRSRIHVKLSIFSTWVQTLWGFYINPVTHSDAAERKRDILPPLFAYRKLKQSQIYKNWGAKSHSSVVLWMSIGILAVLFCVVRHEKRRGWG